MHARKTGARFGRRSPAVMGGATDQLFAALDQYGTEIGLAFQIVDDILDEKALRVARQDRRRDRAAGKPTCLLRTGSIAQLGRVS
jgi:geranylgeranyl pyrophosphate synthase